MYTTEQYPQTKFQNISEVWKSLEVLSFQVDRDRPSVEATDFDGQRRYSFAAVKPYPMAFADFLRGKSDFGLSKCPKQDENTIQVP